MPSRPPIPASGGRTCDGCDLCCRVFEIEELAKPMGRACALLREGRCSIHGFHPKTCQTFRCFWLDRPDLGPEWRPSVAGFVLRVDEDGTTLWVDVDPLRRGAWREPPYYGQLKLWSEAIRTGAGVVMVHDAGVWLLFPERDLFLPDAPRGARFEAGYRAGPNGPEPWVRMLGELAQAAA